MQRGFRLLGMILLSAALTAPLANAKPVAAAQDHDDHDRDRRRVYDPYHKDYHNWDDREDGVYRHWLEGRHRAYVEYDHLKAQRTARILEVASRARGTRRARASLNSCEW